MAKSTIGDFLVKGDEGGIDARQVGVAPGSVHLEALEPARAVLRERPQQRLDLAGELSPRWLNRSRKSWRRKSSIWARSSVSL
jgi:hypothetical protein